MPRTDECEAGSRRARARNARRREEADAHRVDEAVVLVRRVEDELAADGRDADAVAVVPDAGHGALDLPAPRAEAEAVEQRDRPRTHCDDVAEDAADARRRSLERLDGGRVVVALDLERDRLSVAEIDDAGVLARPLKHVGAVRRQPAEERRRVLVPAVLAPEEREDGELEVIGVALEQRADALQLAVGQPEGSVERLFCDRRQGWSSLALTADPAGGDRRPGLSPAMARVRFSSR